MDDDPNNDANKDEQGPVEADADAADMTWVFRSSWRPCDACAGTGFWPNALGERFACVACNGAGRIHEFRFAQALRADVARLKAARASGADVSAIDMEVIPSE